jgi:exopolyphosphatase/guanosine-5'-triphosphate,3'-diphosphate pyrophosphatase
LSVGDASAPIAVIDIGSNSGRLVVVQMDRFGHLDVLETEGTPLRLVHELAVSRTLGEAVAERTLEALRGFLTIARGAGAVHKIAVATAAVREAADGEVFVERLQRETGLTIEIISGEAEAQFGFVGAVHGVPATDGVLMDIGGGSMQLAQFRDRRLVRSWSLPLGALRLSDRFLLTDPPTGSELKKLQEHVRRTLRDAGAPSLGADEQLVGTGGTIRNLAKLERARRDYPIRRLHGYSLGKRELGELVRRLAEQTAPQRTKMPGLNANRFDSIVGGAAGALATLEVVGASAMLVSGHGLREGIALSRLIDCLPSPDQVRRAAVAALAARFVSWNSRLARQRELAAIALQRALAPDLEAEMCESLLHAATLLDIGRSVDFYSRHDHSASIVLAADLSGFSHRRVALLAATIKLSEKDTASLKNWAPLLGSGDQAKLSRVAALLGLADSIARQASDTSPVTVRTGSGVMLEADWLDPWPLRAALRRVQQVFSVNVSVSRQRA